MKKQVYAYLHTHWDREWYQDKESFNLRFIEVFNIILNELKSNKAPFFYLDGQVIALLDYLKYNENKKEEVINLIKNNKLAIGPYFVSADSYLVNFCSMLKNLDLGMKISKEFGQKDYIGYLSDIFGISKSAFEALNFKNINKAIIWRGVNPKKIKNNCNFIKNDINTTWLAQGYFNDFIHNDNIIGLKNYIDKIAKYSNKSILLPIGADHLGILQNANEKIALINSKLKDYEIILTSPFEYFKNTEFKNNIKENEFLDNSDTFVLKGVYSARIPQKIKNAQIQNDLSRLIEPFNYLLKDNFDNNIEEIYKTLIKNHAHDGIYGCSKDSVHKTIDSRLDKCGLIIDAIKKRLIGDFKKKYNISDKSCDTINVFNLSNNALKKVKVKLPYILNNSQILKTEKGFDENLLYDIYKIPITEDITDLYTQLVEIEEVNNFNFKIAKIKKPIKKHRVTKNSLENDFIKLEIKNKNFYIINKITKEKYEFYITDIKDSGDSYNFCPNGKREKIEFLKSEIRYDENIESCLKLYFKNIVLDCYIDNYSDFIKFSANINNKTKNHKIQLTIKSKDNFNETISQEAIGIIKRKINSNYKMEDFMPAKRPIELETNSYPMQNFVTSNNILVLTKGLNEYEIFKNELRICLLRCFSTISNPKNKARSIPAGPDIKTPDGQCIDQYQMEYILSFGDYKKGFKIVDNLFENYIAIDGKLNSNLDINMPKLDKNCFFYGINQNKKIVYDYSKNKSLLI